MQKRSKNQIVIMGLFHPFFRSAKIHEQKRTKIYRISTKTYTEFFHSEEQYVHISIDKVNQEKFIITDDILYSNR